MRKIKIAHVITRLIIGGAQENTIFTVEGLSKTGDYDVTLITGPPLGPEGSLLDGKWRNSVKLILIPEMRRAINPLLDAITYFKLLRIFRKEKYDIIHTHSSKAGILARLAAARAKIKIIVHTIHGLPFHDYQNKLLNRLYILSEKRAAKKSAKLISVADAMTEKAVAAKVAKPGKFITIHSGMDLDAFLNSKKYRPEIRKRFGFEENDLVIGKIARLFHLKGHKYLFEAAREIIEKFRNVRFLLVGDGILKEQFEMQLDAMGIREKFTFAGLVHPDKIPEMISAMDILVHTSLREGLAKTLPQALACGVPVVSFDIDGAKEVVTNGETGFLVEPEDSKKLAESIIKLLSDENLRKEIGEKGREIVDPIFRKEYMLEKIIDLYNSLLDKELSR